LSASRRAHRQDGSRARYTNGEKAPTLQRPCVSECVLLRRVVEKGECRVGRVCEWMRQMDLALYRGMFVGGRGKRVTRDWVTGSLGESRKGRVRIAHGQARGQSRHLFTQSGEKDKEGAVKQRVHALINLHLGPGSPAIIFGMIENRH